MHHAAGTRVGHDRPESARDVDAEMIVEPAVLGGQHRLDQMIRKISERHRAAVLDAAASDFVAVAVQKYHRQFGFLQPIIVSGLAKGRDGKRERHQQSPGAQGRQFRQGFHHQPAPPPGDMEAVHEVAEAFERLAQHRAAAEQAEVETRVEVKEEGADTAAPAPVSTLWLIVVHGRFRGPSCIANWLMTPYCGVAGAADELERRLLIRAADIFTARTNPIVARSCPARIAVMVANTRWSQIVASIVGRAASFAGSNVGAIAVASPTKAGTRAVLDRRTACRQ